jgi:hypothetical protein
MSDMDLRLGRAEAIVRSIASATDPYVALFVLQPEAGFVCGFCGEARDAPHSERCPWFAANLFVSIYPRPESGNDPCTVGIGG